MATSKYVQGKKDNGPECVIMVPANENVFMQCSSCDGRKLAFGIWFVMKYTNEDLMDDLMGTIGLGSHNGVMPWIWFHAQVDPGRIFLNHQKCSNSVRQLCMLLSSYFVAKGYLNRFRQFLIVCTFYENIVFCF